MAGTPSDSFPPGNVFAGQYRFMSKLLKLESCTPKADIIRWPRGPTPVRIDRLIPFLAQHPDQVFAAFVFRGLSFGFHVGFNRQSTQLRSRGKNHPSSISNWATVDAHVQLEVGLGRLVGPVSPLFSHLIHTSPIGLIPKAHQLNKWRLIVDLSAPQGHSINSGINSELCSLSYASLDEAVRVILQLGRGTSLVKLDLKDAYRIVPVHPDDHHLLGITWRGSLYVDRSLPFGLRSAPILFTAVADMITWVLYKGGIRHLLHYLDDFLFFGLPGTKEGAMVRSIALDTLQYLGIPVAPNKSEGPVTCLSFLGVLLDTDNFELRLPQDKLHRLRELVVWWSGRSSATRKEFESLLGHLSQAAMVIRPGRAFLRELFARLKVARAPHHFIRLNAGARADLSWWRCFLQDWNGSSFFPQQSPQVHIYSDAAGSCGCGAFVSSLGWFQLKWPSSWNEVGITAKELAPVVIAAALWGSLWGDKLVCFHSDNMGVVALLKKPSSKVPVQMHLIRCLLFYAAYYKFNFVAEYIPGTVNSIADAISRDRVPLVSHFIPHIPQAEVPQAVADLLVHQQPDWGSSNWTRLFRTTLPMELQHPLAHPTGQAVEDT